MNAKLITYCFIFIGLLTACDHNVKKAAEKDIQHNHLMATFYTYYAAEYQALAYQAYNIAKERLTEIRALNPDKKDLAVVLDIDETVLDNSPYEARMILDNSGYNSETWNTWCNMSVAEPVPGVLDFLQYADKMDFNIFYLSNRKKKYTQKSTLDNLKKMGLPQVSEDHLLLRDGDKSKANRRESISKNYKIVLLVGDNLGDFYEDTQVFSEREQLVEKNKNLFGKKFIVLPNAMYGDWISSLGIQENGQTIDSLLKVMIQPYDE